MIVHISLTYGVTLQEVEKAVDKAVNGALEAPKPKVWKCRGKGSGSLDPRFANRKPQNNGPW